MKYIPTKKTNLSVLILTIEKFNKHYHNLYIIYSIGATEKHRRKIEQEWQKDHEVSEEGERCE